VNQFLKSIAISIVSLTVADFGIRSRMAEAVDLFAVVPGKS
jgi:hypothetical protein